MAKALRNYVSTPVPQSRAVSEIQVQNNAGGYTFEVSPQTQLERFLILGTDGGTYYVGEVDLTTQNVDFLRKMIKSDPFGVVQTATDISLEGRAYRNGPAIFTLALVLAEGSNEAKMFARGKVALVARTATMIYELAEYIDKLGGWGPAKVKAIRSWFESKTPEQLAYQAVKYRQRNGWTLRDLMRLSHPKNVNKNVGNFILRGEVETAGPEILAGFKWIQNAKSVKDVLAVLTVHPNLPWEAIPTQFLKESPVWEKLFENGLNGQALVRNVTRFAKLGSFNDQVFAREFANTLTDEDMIKKTRLHPMQYLNAYIAYNQGTPTRNSGLYFQREKTWTVNGIIRDALDDGFGLAFGNIIPAEKRTMISVDTSASMGWWTAGNTALSCYQAAAAMGLITARTEPYYEINAFSTVTRSTGISARDSIETAFRKIENVSGGGTDCSQPMLSAIRDNKKIDTFIVITDNETWAGRIHPHKALEDYRQKFGIPAKVVVMAMVPTKFSIANPLDSGMLDVVGFDANTPRVLADFSAGRL